MKKKKGETPSKRPPAWVKGLPEEPLGREKIQRAMGGEKKKKHLGRFKRGGEKGECREPKSGSSEKGAAILESEGVPSRGRKRIKPVRKKPKH